MACARLRAYLERQLQKQSLEASGMTVLCGSGMSVLFNIMLSHLTAMLCDVSLSRSQSLCYLAGIFSSNGSHDFAFDKMVARKTAWA